ncbi:MAG TPA: hypothetical protein VF614_15390 [Chthoniobacteraceae bacterium]|jgi:hypothetical protein
MTEARIPYQKLPIRSFGWAGPARLWLGPDHLLQVSTTSVSERYRRFYLRDIEAVLVRRTNLRLVLNLISGGLAGLGVATGGAFWWMASLAPDESGAIALRVFAAIFGLFAVACLLFLLINSLLGATCACFVQTPAGLDRLATPGRSRQARKLIQRLAPLIAAAQAPAPETTPAVTP